MTGIAARFKKNAAPPAVRSITTACLRPQYAKGNGSRKISPPLTVTDGVEHQVTYLSDYYTPQSRERDSDDDGSVTDFDIGYFYGGGDSTNAAHAGNCSPSRQRSTRCPTDHRNKQTTLIPLLTAQWRNSIRRRAEGFEMKEQPASRVTAKQTLISLEDALARDDIRRRDEGFELTSKMQPPPFPAPVPQTQRISRVSTPSHDPQNPEIPSQLSSDLATMPSVYSSESWAQSLRVISAIRSLPSITSADWGNLVTGHSPGTGTSVVEEDPGDHSNSSMDEASFMRMAAPLGW